jgi:hypothetical protein
MKVVVQILAPGEQRDAVKGDQALLQKGHLPGGEIVVLESGESDPDRMIGLVEVLQPRDGLLIRFFNPVVFTLVGDMNGKLVGRQDKSLHEGDFTGLI